MSKYPLVRKIYLYLFSLVGLVLVVIGGVRLVGLGLKAYIFTEADRYYAYPVSRPKIAPLPRVISEEPLSDELVEPSQEEIDAYEAKQRTSNRQREAAEAIAMILVGAPLYFYHWRVVQKDRADRS